MPPHQFNTAIKEDEHYEYSQQPKPQLKKAAVEINNLYYNYPDGTAALQGLNLTVYEGESVAIVGHNGAGKSTLIKHLNGILRGTGEISIGGLAINALNIKKIRRLVGMVFQHPDDQLFCPTVYDDVAFGLMNMGWDNEAVKTRVERTLKDVGLSGLKNRPAHHLSFGQRKRVALATVLSMQPQILVLDEPTSNLDPRNERLFMELVSAIKTTKIIVSHDLLLLFQLCERFIVLEQGRVTEDASRENFISKHSLIARHGLDYTFKCNGGCPYQ